MRAVDPKIMRGRKSPANRRRPALRRRMASTKKTAWRRAMRINVFGTARRQYLMGEEKPDEELMGKRKSSPRLSSASIQGINADILMMSRLKKNIHAFQKNFGMIFQRTFRCGTIKLCDKHDAASAVRLVDPFGRIAVPEGIKLRCMRSDANVAQLSVHPIERFQGVQRL